MPWIQTRSGKRFDYADIKPEMIDIEDIAFALSNLCRYVGHVPFYSVAEHSLLVSFVVPEENALQGLLHDASEAYTGDVPRPLKTMCPELRKIEAEIEKVIAGVFKLDLLMPLVVRKVDDRMLITEQEALFREHVDEPVVKGESLPFVGISCFPPEKAREFFLQRFYELI